MIPLGELPLAELFLIIYTNLTKYIDEDDRQNIMEGIAEGILDRNEIPKKTLNDILDLYDMSLPIRCEHCNKAEIEEGIPFICHIEDDSEDDSDSHFEKKQRKRAEKLLLMAIEDTDDDTDNDSEDSSDTISINSTDLYKFYCSTECKNCYTDKVSCRNCKKRT